MAEVCTRDATLRYVPLGKRANGFVFNDGIALWRETIESFDAFTVDVRWIRLDQLGNAYCEVFTGGRQAKDAFGVENRGRDVWLEQLYILHASWDGRIDRLTAYWDQAEFYRQLGKATIEDPLF